MRLENLTDNELIDYIIKHDPDPVRVRLATHMQRVHGAIIDDLVDAGMDDAWCTFENTYHPGQYIRHLESEIDYLNEKREQDQKEIAELQARTVAELIQELNQQITTEKYNTRYANEQRNKSEEKARLATEKLDMWAILNR